MAFNSASWQSLKQPSTQHILGAGAVGHLLACLQTKADYPCQLLGRKIQSAPYRVQFCHADKQTTYQLTYANQPNAIIRHLWLAVKSYQVEEALGQVVPYLDSSSRVFLLQNGMGNLEQAQSKLVDVIPPENIFIAINTHGALLEQETTPVTVHHTGVGTITIGHNYLASNEREISLNVNELVSPDLNPVWQDDIQQALWAKLGINAVINPLTALHQCRNGELLTNSEYRVEAEQLMAELRDFYQLMDYQQLADNFAEKCCQVIESTASNYSSMMLDKKFHRPTEIAAITGYLLSSADSVRLPMKAHRSLFHRLQKN